MNEGGLGMFYSDREKRIHFVYTKDGCCWHQTQGFDVYHGRPRKVYELIENAAHGDGSIVEITTGKLIRGRWHEWTKHVDASVYYKQ